MIKIDTYTLCIYYDCKGCKNHDLLLSHFIQIFEELQQLKQQIWDPTATKQNVKNFFNQKNKRELQILNSALWYISYQDQHNKIFDCIKGIQDAEAKLHYLQTGKQLQGAQDYFLYVNKEKQNFYKEPDYSQVDQKLKKLNLPVNLCQQNLWLSKFVSCDYKKFKLFCTFLKQRKYLDLLQSAYPKYIHNCSCNIYHSSQYEKQRLIQALEQQKQKLAKIFCPILYRFMLIQRQNKIMI